MKEQQSECVICINNLSKSFDGRPVLKKISLNLYKGENLVILGRSGIGKSVLIKCIVSLIQPDEGEIIVLGKNIPDLDIKELDEIRGKVGFSFQGSALYDSMTVRENLEFPLKRKLGIYDQKKLDEMVKDALEDVGLSHAIDQLPSELSGGMRKRIGIARTLILKPEIMLYDEPTAGLDPITSNEINQLMISMRKKYGTSSLIITHDITCAKTIGNRIIYIHDGQAYLEGTFEELDQAEDPILRTFFDYYKMYSE